MTKPSFGARVTADGVSFALWAPAARQVDLLLDRPQPMRHEDDGWYRLDVGGLAAGARYKFRIDGEIDLPDPASSFQPDDVFGPSEVIDHASYQWSSADWRGRPWEDAVLIETHVGTFTRDGSYRGMIDKLDHLVDTGITALELMPIADFAGRRNWGYDGVLWYAPDSAYGRPEDLKALIDAAHQRGLMVFLDVVYNHFGPEGNFLHRYAPTFFTAAETPWGSVIDYGKPEVRAFAVNSALCWLRDYRFDGLRFDAANHIVTPPGGISMLHDLSIAAGKLAAETGQHIHLVLENGDNIASMLDPVQEPPSGKFRAQWNDDYHHAFHVLLTGESQGYYGDYQRSPRGHIARALAAGFVYQGEIAAFWGNRPRGEPSGALPPTAFVSFLQNHDQTGNRALGERLDSLADPKQIEAALAITLLAPMMPMLFMGEEWGSRRPFLFFCDFAGGLAEAVRKGRRQEYEWAYARYGDAIPDPLDPKTFSACVLDWEARDAAPGRDRLMLVQRLLEVRRREIVPRLAGARHGDAQASDDGLLTAHWPTGDGATLRLAANLSATAITLPAERTVGALIWGTDSDRLPAWSVCWRLASGAARR
jgi:maltooligosyltrehalose trehalohydrolase